MDRPPAYSADRAANVMLGLSIAAAILFVAVGAMQLDENRTVSWLLFAVAALLVASALLIRRSIRRPKQ